MNTLFTVSVLLAILPCLLCQGGGMAELKSITGDAPYHGVGNAPAPIPQPMGFWGRPRYSPMGFGSPYMGGGWGGPLGGGSISRSPYGGPGYSPFNSPNYSPFGSLLGGLTSMLFDDGDNFGGASPFQQSPRSFASPSSPRSFTSQPTPFSGSSRGGGFDSLPKSFEISRGAAGGAVAGGQPNPSLSSLTGGFYKGQGNPMSGRK